MQVDIIKDIVPYLPKYTVIPNNVIEPVSTIHTAIIEPLMIPDNVQNTKVFENNSKHIDEFDEELLEKLLNFEDESAGYTFTNSFRKIRRYNRRIISALKSQYKGKCQICGFPFKLDNSEIDITEAHHIEYFAKSLNNQKSNLIILCPNHHALLHRINPVYDKEKKLFIMPNGFQIKITVNFHL